MITNYSFDWKDKPKLYGVRPNRYHAEIHDDSGIITKLAGKTNTRKDLETWLKREWKAPLEYQKIEPWESPIILRIWSYGSTKKLILYARRPG